MAWSRLDAGKDRSEAVAAWLDDLVRGFGLGGKSRTGVAIYQQQEGGRSTFFFSPAATRYLNVRAENFRRMVGKPPELSPLISCAKPSGAGLQLFAGNELAQDLDWLELPLHEREAASPAMIKVGRLGVFDARCDTVDMLYVSGAEDVTVQEIDSLPLSPE